MWTGDAHRPALVLDRADQRLLDPPDRVGGEHETAVGIELLDRADQAQVALLDEIREGHTHLAEAARALDHQPQVVVREDLNQVLIRLQRLGGARQGAARRRGIQSQTPPLGDLGAAPPGCHAAAQRAVHLLEQLEGQLCGRQCLHDVGTRRSGPAHQLGYATQVLVDMGVPVGPGPIAIVGGERRGHQPRTAPLLPALQHQDRSTRDREERTLEGLLVPSHLVSEVVDLLTA